MSDMSPRQTPEYRNDMNEIRIKTTFSKQKMTAFAVIV